MKYPERRLKELRDDAGLSQQAVADRIGISDTAYQNYEHGDRDIPGNVIEALALLYDTSTDFILGLVKYKNKAAKPRTDGFVDVPIYGSIAAGTPIEMIEIEGSHPVPAEVVEEYPDAFLLTVRGQSMNRILPDGCYALVDPCEDVERDNQPHAVCVNGYDATIKRVHKLANGFELVPDSTDPTYKAKVYDYGEQGTEEITVIGRVVYHVLPFDWSY